MELRGRLLGLVAGALGLSILLSHFPWTAHSQNLQPWANTQLQTVWLLASVSWLAATQNKLPEEGPNAGSPVSASPEPAG